MQGLAKAFSYLIAAHFQALGILAVSWFIGDYLDKNYPISFSWLLIFVPIGVLGMAHSFYVIVMNLRMQEKNKQKESEKM